MLEETKAVAEEVHEDLQNLKPNVILDTLKSWLPGLMSFGYRLAIAILILVIGNRIVHVVRRFLQKTFERMNMDPSVSRFLISVADACIYALAIFIAADKLGIPSASIIALLGSAGLAVGLSLQGSLANVAGGILLMLLRPFGVHDYIVSDGYEGTVQKDYHSKRSDFQQHGCKCNSTGEAPRGSGGWHWLQLRHEESQRADPLCV